MENHSRQLTDLINEYQIDCQIQGKSQETIKWYREVLNRFRKYLAERYGIDSLSSLTKAHIRDYIRYTQVELKTHRSHQPLAGATIRGYVRGIKAFLAWTLREDYQTENLSAKITLPKEPLKVIETFSTEQVKAMLDTCRQGKWANYKDFTIILLMLDCGLRLSEVIHITMDDLRLPEGTIKLRVAKGNKERIVPIGSLLQKVLLKYISDYRPKPLTDRVNNLFLSRQGLPFTKSGVEQIIRRRGRRAGIKNVRCSPHTLRHTFAKNYLLNGGDIFSLQKILGHSSLASVRIYLNLYAVDIKKQHQKYSPVDNLAPSIGRYRF